MRHTISILVQNKSGVFTRIGSLFSARGFNLDGISVGPTEDPSVSRLTIVTHGNDKIIEQVNKQLNKLIDVIKVVDLTFEDHVERELALIKVSSNKETRNEIMQLVNIFRANIIDISQKTITIEATGGVDKVQALINMLRQFGIREVARTGTIALKREYKNEQK